MKEFSSQPLRYICSVRIFVNFFFGQNFKSSIFQLLSWKRSPRNESATRAYLSPQQPIQGDVLDACYVSGSSHLQR